MENVKKDSNILETMPVGTLFIKMAVPAVLSQLINILYNLVDKMFIGHMKIGGEEALAGLGVTTPNPTIGVFLAEPIADFVAVCTTGTLFYRYYKRELADKTMKIKSNL